MSRFRSPEELELLLMRNERIEFDLLRDAWFRSVKSWSYRDILRGKQIISAYAGKVVLN